MVKVKKKFNWKQARMFERRGSRRLLASGEESVFNALHKIISAKIRKRY